MTKINIPQFDITLNEVDKALENNTEGYTYPEVKIEKWTSLHLGMSQIGDPCWRKLFYSYRNVIKRKFSSQGIKAIEDGHIQELVMITRLKLLPDIKLITHDDKGEQIGIKLLLDHFSGRLDGEIEGIKEAPKTIHIWEHKSVNEKKFAKLIDIRNKSGEKNTLEEWDIIYYDQAQIYMHCRRRTRHYLTVTSPGGRKYASVRTDYNKKYAEGIIIKAQSIIFDNDLLPDRISNKREYYLCQWCDYQGICHDGEIPLAHCRTCKYCKSVKDGKFYCLHEENNIPEKFLLKGCRHHVYNPALIQLQLKSIESDCCIYVYKGVQICNAGSEGFPTVTDNHIEIFTSKKLKEISTIDNLLSIVEKNKPKEKSINDQNKAWE